MHVGRAWAAAVPGWHSCASDLACLHAGGLGRRIWGGTETALPQSTAADGDRHVGDFQQRTVH